jgi:hypothetical protein
MSRHVCVVWTKFSVFSTLNSVHLSAIIVSLFCVVLYCTISVSHVILSHVSVSSHVTLSRAMLYNIMSCQVTVFSTNCGHDYVCITSRCTVAHYLSLHDVMSCYVCVSFHAMSCPVLSYHVCVVWCGRCTLCVCSVLNTDCVPRFCLKAVYSFVVY